MTTNILSLDIGEKRVGAALARGNVGMAFPHATLQRTSKDFWDELLKLITKNDVAHIVLGLPRGLNGQDTDQTRLAREFGAELASKTTVPITWQDEALTSVRAENMLRSQGKPHSKGDIDALAASLILTDYLETHKVSG